MASQGPRERYPGANSLSLFNAQGTNPLQDCKVFGNGVTKVYDKSVKGYVYSINGGLQSKLQLPKNDSKTGFQLLHHFLVLQVFVPRGTHFSVELRVSDTNNTRRKMYFSTSFSNMKSTNLQCQIPISMVVRNKWLSLAFHVADLFNSCFWGDMNFRSIDSIVLGPVCKLWKIFSMRCRIMKTAPKRSLEEWSEDCLPQEHLFATGVDTCFQILDMTSLQLGVLGSNEAHGTAHTDGSQAAVDPELGTGARARKGTKGTTQNTRVVHLSLGTRIPLPVSTIQINTNLPHDNCPGFLKDRIGRVHFVCDPVSGEARKSKSASNMGFRALTVVPRRQEIQRMKVDRGVSDWKETKRTITGQTGYVDRCPEEKDPTNTPHLGIGEQEKASREHQIPASQDALLNSPKVCSQNGNITAGGHVRLDTKCKSPSKWGLITKVMTSTHMKQQRQDSRSKEYKCSTYMDSPPGSPPRGWDRCTGENQSDDKAFNDHFSEGSWMNSQLSESIDLGQTTPRE